MSQDKLDELTNSFMESHWNRLVHENPPYWSDFWNFTGPIPNGSYKGCYALYSETELIYVGVAIDAAINVRTASYTNVAANGYNNLNRPYKPIKEWELNGLKAIRTIGFPDFQWYLAAALEKYLISELKPRYNKLGK